MISSQEGHASTTEILLRKLGSASINAKRNADGDTALILAAWKGHAHVVKVLLRHGAHPDITNKTKQLNNGSTPLLFAAEEGRSDVVDLLIEAGAQIDKENMGLRTPLICAVQNGHMSVILPLLRGGANVNKCDKLGWSALTHAAHQGHLSIISILLSQGAIVTTSQRNISPLKIAFDIGDHRVILMLLNHVGMAAQKGALTMAVQRGYLPVIRALLEKGLNVQEVNSKGKTLLMIAAECGRIDAVKILLRAGADSRATSITGMTALMYAAKRGRSSTLKMLLELSPVPLFEWAPLLSRVAQKEMVQWAKLCLSDVLSCRYFIQSLIPVDKNLDRQNFKSAFGRSSSESLDLIRCRIVTFLVYSKFSMRHQLKQIAEFISV